MLNDQSFSRSFKEPSLAKVVNIRTQRSTYSLGQAPQFSLPLIIQNPSNNQPSLAVNKLTLERRKFDQKPSWQRLNNLEDRNQMIESDETVKLVKYSGLINQVKNSQNSKTSRSLQVLESVLSSQRIKKVTPVVFKSSQNNFKVVREHYGN